MKNKKFITFLILLCFLAIIIFRFFSTKNIQLYNDLNLITKDFKTSFQKEVMVFYGDTVDLSCTRSSKYKLKYTAELGKYDSIYYFGEYPLIEDLKDTKPNLYEKYESFHNSLFDFYNTFLSYFGKNHYVVYVLYKNGKIEFCKTKNTTGSIRILGNNFMIKNKQKYIVHVINYKQADGSIVGEVRLKEVD